MKPYEHNLDFIFYDKEMQLDILHELIDFGNIGIMSVTEVNLLSIRSVSIQGYSVYCYLYVNDINICVTFSKCSDFDSIMYKVCFYYKRNTLFYEKYTHKNLEKNEILNLDVYNRVYKLREAGII